MMHRKFVWPLALVFGLVVMAYTADQNSEQKEGKLLRHVVFFKFKDDATQEQIDKVVEAFRDLKNKIPTIKEFEWGTNNSPEGLDQGFTHCFVATFSSEKDRDDYLPHPEHKEFVKILGPVLDKVFVVDYWAQ